MKVKIPPKITDDVSEFLKRINDFTDRRKIEEELNRKIFDSIKTEEMKRVLTNAIEEHLNRKTSKTPPKEISSSLKQPFLEIYIRPNNASTKTVFEVLKAINDYHRALGGLGLEFTFDGQYMYASEEVTV